MKAPKSAEGAVRGILLLWTVTLLVVAVMMSATNALGQSQAINGTVRGRVSDVSGASVEGATVTIHNSATGLSKTTQTGTDGYYVFPNLPLGTYDVEVTKQSFAMVKAAKVLLEAGKEAVIDAHMPLASVSTTVEVSGGAPIIEPTRVNVGRTIDTKEVENLPLTSRNPYNFIIFQPGVSGHPNPELGIPRTINTNGLLDRINYQMDGMVDSQQDRHGLRLFPISDTYVREVQTVSNSYAPEFGMTSGNIFNVITNSGTNDVHGTFQYIHRWIDATARPILLPPTAPKPELKLNDYSGNAGGRIIKDKLFWFGAYEHVERGQPSPVTITAANAAQIGLDPKVLATGPGTLHGQFVDSRLDWVINSKHSAFLRYNYFKNSFPFNTNVGGLFALDSSSDFRDRAHVIGAQVVSALTSNLLNEFRFSWPLRSNTHFPGALTGPGPAVQIQGIANFNGTTGAGDVFTEKIPNFNENLTWIHATHSFKWGGAWQQNIDLQKAVSFTQYIFPSIAAYQSAKSGANPFAYSTVNVSNGGVVPSYHSVFFSLYGQDNWQMTPRLTLIYGVRYDKFVPPPADANAPFIDSRNFNSPGANFSPRVGFAYRLTPKTVVRGSGGIFYESPATNTWFNALLNNGTLSSVSLGPTSAGAPPYPRILTSATPPATPNDVTSVAPNFRNAYTINTSLQLSRELSSNDSITLGFIHTGARNLEFLHNINLINPIATLADGRPVYSKTVSASTRLFPQFNNILLQESGARSTYNAGTVNYTHRLSAGVQVSAAYTWSHTISDAPDVNSFEQNLPTEDPSNRLRDRGNSLVNRPQAFTLSSIIEPTVNSDNRLLHALLNHNMFSVLGNLSSGDQQNITGKTVINGDQKTSAVTRPLFIPRNSVRGPSIYQVDLRYTRTIATLWERVVPQFFLEANNVFNHPNVTSLNTSIAIGGLNSSGLPTATTGLPVNSAGGVIPLPSSFPASSTVLEGRIVQLGLAVHF
ncbi:MAG: TonB-dependent receptor domain-containing protein [Terriglobales bacterium]